jgi:hypothetical protein
MNCNYENLFCVYTFVFKPLFLNICLYQTFELYSFDKVCLYIQYSLYTYFCLTGKHAFQTHITSKSCNALTGFYAYSFL